MPPGMAAQKGSPMKSSIFGAVALSLLAAPILAQQFLPEPYPSAPPIPAPQDTPYPGTIALNVDATDLSHHIFRAHETIPVKPRPARSSLCAMAARHAFADRRDRQILRSLHQGERPASGMEARSGGRLRLSCRGARGRDRARRRHAVRLGGGKRGRARDDGGR